MILSACKIRIHRTNAGFTYIGLLIAVALMGILLVSMATVWHQVQQQENERQLLFIGNQFRQAIGSYYESTPSQVKQFPKKLEDLIEDKRTPFIARHLRKIFHDPFTGSIEWGLVKGADEGIVGVYSKSDVEPLKKANFSKTFAMFEGMKHYSDWQFVYAPGSLPAAVVAQTDSPTAEVIPPDYVPKPPPPVSGSPDIRTKRLCASMNSIDLRACLYVAKNIGDAAGAICLDSAAQRYIQCLNGDMLSSLIVEYKSSH